MVVATVLIVMVKSLTVVGDSDGGCDDKGGWWWRQLMVGDSNGGCIRLRWLMVPIVSQRYLLSNLPPSCNLVFVLDKSLGKECFCYRLRKKEEDGK
ncbi:hypothetical protein HAX54_036327, partial [Datura stramonium]|nr:hypothetical protein [Datura stramonium]